jgi:hypothetical protein
MTPKQQFVCKLAGIILGALVPIVLAFLTFLQAQGNEATALRKHDEARRRRRRFTTHAPAPELPRAPEFSRRTNLEALAESTQVAADNAADDTVKVLVQPTTVGRLLGMKARSVKVRALRK